MTAPINSPEYNPGIPLVEDNLADSQSNFFDNFRTLYDAFSRNHVDLDNLTGSGNHTVVELIEQNEPLSTFSDEIVFYTKKVADQTDQLFMRYPRNGKEFQLSQYQIYQIESTPLQTSFFTFLPGGIIVYFGRVNPDQNEFTISINPSVCRNIMGINLCPIGTAKALNYQSNIRGFTGEGGIVTGITLISSDLPLNQFYLAFGNI